MLFNDAGEEVRRHDGYVPDVMCPTGGGYGDYIIMHVNGDGVIEKWNQDDIADLFGH